MKISDQTTLAELKAELAQSGKLLALHYEHGNYHAYAYEPGTKSERFVGGYARGELAEAIAGALR